MLVCGDFNLNLKKKENNSFVTFMLKEFNLKLITNIEESTTMKNSCIDLFFSRNLNLNLKNYITYFSYHKPIFGALNIN